MPEGVGYGPQFTASTGFNLNVIGKHAYAYNRVAASTTTQTVLEFTSGNFLFVGTLHLAGFVDDDNPTTRAAAASECQFNDSTVLILSTVAYRSPMSDTAPIIIPPYTSVKITVDAESDDADAFATLSLAGRIHK